MNDNRHVNRHPADELADVRGKLKALEAREAELRDVLLSGAIGLVGDEHVATIRTTSQARLDLPALREHFGGRLKPFAVEREVTYVRVGRR